MFWVMNMTETLSALMNTGLFEQGQSRVFHHSLPYNIRGLNMTFSATGTGESCLGKYMRYSTLPACWMLACVLPYGCCLTPGVLSWVDGGHLPPSCLFGEVQEVFHLTVWLDAGMCAPFRVLSYAWCLALVDSGRLPPASY